ncbi:hypothetical protein JCM10207_003886 [Rhodosporidiobolus poonsookiae]
MEPATPKPKIQVDCAYNLVVTVDFHADLTKPETIKIPLDLPLHGKWLISGYKQDQDVRLALANGQMAVGRLGHDVDSRYTLFWLEAGKAHELHGGVWDRAPLPDKREDGGAYSSSNTAPLALEEAATASNGRFDPSSHRAYRLVYRFDSHSPAASSQTDEKLLLATRLSNLSLEHNPHTLRLVFSRPDKTEAELWASGKLLSSKLPYFKDLLESDFEEATVRRSKRARKSGAQPVDPDENVTSIEASDDETDDLLFTVKPQTSNDSPESADAPFHEIRVKHAAYSTYYALLVYLQTGYIRFALLKSACSPLNPASLDTRTEQLSSTLSKDSALPPPVSPKSLYRLIDLLRLPESDSLHGLCLRAYGDSLTHHGAAHELFSDVCICFGALRKVALEYVAEHYDEVTATPSWNEMMGRVERDEVPGSSAVLVELLRATRSAEKKKG